ncbi:fumarylacetoacetate hydrolase family protein [Pseudonocardia xishanensis]|uniref:Fumarylacetoacetase-like C-terminal domain-containing protein n=1 Tax=Pseudonocardia xishanensis TaxID=630995 RepID=A0ABP8RSN0_9PSEU
MKLAVARLGADRIPTVVEVDGEKATVVVGAAAADLVEVAVHPQRYTGRGESIALADLELDPPLARPASLRDFMAYDAHLINSLAGLGQTPHPSWYEEPIFYFSNPAAVIGHGAAVRRPRGSVKLDYEVELAAVVGREAADLDAEDPAALDCLAGFTLMNDWSARDLAAKEMRHHLGPVKGKDFATSLGPWLVTPDELPIVDGVVDVPVVARVNGAVHTDNTFRDMTFDWRRILARASANTTLVPGDVIGSGTVGFGCLLELRTRNKELGEERYRFLADGDVVEIEAAGLGVLRNVVGQP